MTHPTARKFLASLLALTATGFAQAHTGHGTESLMEGLTHPLGLDHLLAMVAVGLWSVKQLTLRDAWQGPVTFMAALFFSATLGQMVFASTWMETVIALSVVLFGVMLIGQKTLGKFSGLALIAVAASLHGLAHGAETPETGFMTYAIGFMFTTAFLHASGLGLGLVIQRFADKHRGLAYGSIGSAMTGAGIYFISQI
jgi:urease accessory protein